MKRPRGGSSAGGHEQRRPDHRVELEDVLREELQVGGPQGGGEVLPRPRVGRRRVVVEQRVDPHVDDVGRIPRHGDPPGDVGPRDGDVLDGLRDAPRLVEPVRRTHEGRVRVVQREQPVAVGRQPKEPVLLLDPFHRAAMLRAVAPVEQVVLRVERLARRAVPPAVRPLVDVTGLVDALEHRLHAGGVLRVGGADEEVVRQPERSPQLPEPGGDHVGVLLRGPPEGLRGARDLVAVLVGPGQEERVVAELAVVTGEDVGHDRGVRVTDVRLCVHVVDRGRDVETAAHLTRV